MSVVGEKSGAVTPHESEEKTASTLKPPAQRLYGRQRGHPLRDRQQRLIDEALPRIRFPEDKASDPKAAFDTQPEQVWLEVGFGGGEHVLSQIEMHPSVGYIASEVFENGLCSLLAPLFPSREEATSPVPPLLRLWDDDARLLLQNLPEASLDRMFLMFPDPWPKKRHAKRRFVHPGNLPFVARALKPGAIWRVASDDPTYQAWVEEVMDNQDFFETAPPALERPEGWPPTRYEAKAIKAGRQPMYWTFVRK
ncbi:tRNA (guanine-N(7)-)-methyltransferase [Acetobacter aceti NRIC 0242]|uniref:tRNA (guanine-N(7)-)-methyltransferase n=1 Tax=Acetobacter aceti NBRC 14818 TaxID=887700 RepID=A0AB33IEK5_ACEAC|nr:tRNA (guanine(46)-N(7))-methyltransferase TrmB [Acetobacter aceti]BCK75428.1 tRNA (guanine-N(7)-)-methyltransferase [Acetobacter aceti NBRC 14818]GAN58681.1 tRNA (guanine-N(7)-)-methyltransferase [Acetobacter aceti NBRC 14818]GBO81369.1 tRNA (guanine-N(7)-)-methyltransferase [Acetobacter aceti NRIC 0242]